MIHTDGTHNTLVHHRRIADEIAGHEFWGLDGQTIWYDWQPIKGQDFYLGGYNLSTGKRTAYHMERNDWSIHFNLTRAPRPVLRRWRRSRPGRQGPRRRVD